MRFGERFTTTGSASAVELEFRGWRPQFARTLPQAAYTARQRS